MKVIKKITAIMLSIMMVLGMCSVVGADTSEPNSGRIDEVPGSISISNAKAGETYKIYRLLNLDSYKYTHRINKSKRVIIHIHSEKITNGRNFLQRIQQ